MTQQPVLSTALVLENPVIAFSLWSTQHGKSYSEDEHAHRLSVFQGNAKAIAEHNARGSSYEMALNEYADLTSAEFAGAKLGALPGSGRTRSPRSTGFMHEQASAPESIDWRKKGAVSEVKNQAMCGSCWAFSTTGSIEGINAIYSGELVSLSEQELVDCDTSRDQGCSGGLMDFAFQFVKDNGGLDTERDYAYWGSSTWCDADKESRNVVSIDGFEDVPVNDEHALKKAVSQQPISVAICASESLQFYSKGIVEECCTELDHGVLAVGYGVQAGIPFWIVKNSWGGSWGEEGFFRLRRNVASKKGTCGIATTASYPIKSSPNPPAPPPTPETCGWFGYTACAPGSHCYCSVPFPILDLFCIWYSCAPDALAT